MKYERYESVDGTVYKAEPGKDGITEDDMRDLRRIAKSSQKTEAKVKKLDTVSIEVVTEDGWQELDVSVIVEEQDEYSRLHTAIATLAPEQQHLIHAVYFEDVSVSDYAHQVGVTRRTIYKQLEKIFAKIKKNL